MEGHAQRAFWGFDSEFMMSGRANAPEDVHSVQFSNAKGNAVVLESAEDLQDWLYNHDYIKTMYGFVMLCDLGSIQEWLGKKSTEPMRRRGSQLIGYIKYRRTKIKCFDIHPLCKSFGWDILNNVVKSLVCLNFRSQNGSVCAKVEISKNMNILLNTRKQTLLSQLKQLNS